MKIFYDHQVFSWQKIGGVSRYFIELVRHLPDDIGYVMPPMFSENVYLDTLGDSIPAVKSLSFANYRVRKKIYEAVNQLRSASSLSRGGYDVVHPTYYSPYFLKRLKAPYVITVHDFIHEKYPQYFSDASKVIREKKEVVTRADRIIAISEHTRRDLMDIYGLPAERVDVIYHGASPLSSVHEPVGGVGERFVLFVGDRTKYKNFMNLTEAFAIMSKTDPELQLVCAGKPFSDAERAHLACLGIGGRSIACFATDSQLAWLYANTSCFVFPSEYEGFGLPILEAWSAGAPVALSRASCFPEIAGDAALWFDAADPAMMARAVSEAVYDADTRRRLRNLSSERLKMFTWEKTAELTAGIYRSLSAQ